ncbi:MAG TPA: DUF2695 domain-containing protein [Desulfosporosinus sp.]|nr:DUF2695 domain-containing protein [Desulfosporosinus sp.]
MSLGNGKRTANRDKRQELREQIDPEKEVLKDKKQIREEVKRRLVSGIGTMPLEYDFMFNEEKANLNKDSDLLTLLFKRMFFYRLNEKLTAFECDHTLHLSEQILTQMQFNRGKMNEILEVLKKNGGVCDCEIIFQVERQLIGK